jgi:anaerobic magnesium-protoporphyrin IX monomethyl ester cyclase
LIKAASTDKQIIVGFSTNSYTYSEALRLAEIVKKSNPNAHITFGGYHVAPLAKQVLMNKGFVDSVVRGDGEVPFRGLITALSLGKDLCGVVSLTYRKDGHIISNPNAHLPELDSLPYPARDLLQLDKCLSNFKGSLFHKLYNIERILYVSATRGCPHKCNFCSIFNKEWRTRSPSKIVDEFKYLIENYNADSIYLVGDNINLNRKWVLDLCDNIIRRNMNIKWTCATLNPMMIDDEIISKMHDSGCVRATFGFESGAQKMLNSMNKGSSIKKMKDVVNIEDFD